MHPKYSIILLANVVLVAASLSGCGKLSGNSPSAKSAANKNAAVKKDLPPADFTTTSEQLVKEFVANEAKRQELEKKYSGRTIAVTGKVSSIWQTNRASPANYFILSANVNSGRGNELFLYCEFREGDTEQMEPVSAGDNVKVQGRFKHGFGFPDQVMLDNCAVLEPK